MPVRTFGPDDIPFAAELSGAEGWGFDAQDLQRLLELEPCGCFVAEEHGEPVGFVTSIAYGKAGWIGNLMVKSSHRRRGHGRALLDAVTGHLIDRGVRTVSLDAPLQAEPFYRNAGFTPAYHLLHMRRSAFTAPEPAPDSVEPMEEKDLHAVAVFDWACFGGFRQPVLQVLLRESPVALIAQDAAGVAGYLMARRRRDGWVIGPWACVRAAEALLTGALAAIGDEPVRLAVPKVNQRALAALRNQGFTVYYFEKRMYYGDQEGTGHPEHIYATASPDKG